MRIGSATFSGGMQARAARSRRRAFSLQARAMIWLAAGMMSWGGVIGLALGAAALARRLAGQA